MERRQFTRIVGGVSVATVTGCLGGEETSSGSPESPMTSDTDNTCQSDLERIGLDMTVGSGPLDGFDLTLSNDSVSTGDTLVAKLRNVTEEQQDSGNRSKYDIQFRKDDGWQSLFWKDPYVAWTDEAISHAPGEGFTWELEVNRNGLSQSRQNGPDYHVCKALDSGSYRFVYWGLTTKGGDNTDSDPAIGVRFEVTGD